MRWSFVLPGQPPSWNDSYDIVKRWRRTKKGDKATYMTLAKKEEVVEYQRTARLVVQSAKPSRWAPLGQVRITYRFFLSNDIDCDNMQKAIHDVIEKATGVDDKEYLPCVQSKHLVPKREARVEVDVEDLESSFVVPPPSIATPSPSSASSTPYPPTRR